MKVSTIGHVTAHDTMRYGNTVQLAPGGVEWEVAYVKTDGDYMLRSPGGKNRTVAPSGVVSVNGARIVNESEWVRGDAP